MKNGEETEVVDNKCVVQLHSCENETYKSEGRENS